METLSFQDFQRMELKIGKIIAVEDIEGKDKLYKLKVDVGNEITLVAGIKENYSKEDLEGKEIVVITNLQPATIAGITSQGMLLAADVNGEPVLLSVGKEILPGEKILGINEK